MNIKELRQKRHDAHEKAKGIRAKMETEKRVMSAEEKVDFEAAIAERDSMDTEIAAAMAVLDGERSAATGSKFEVGADLTGKKPWGSFGEQLLAVATATKTNGRVVDPRLYAALGANETVDAEGGFLVQTEFSTQLLKTTYDVGILAQDTYKQPMSSARLVIPAVDESSRQNGSRWGGLQAFWEGEAQSYQPTKPKFRLMEVTAKKLTGLCYATEELLADAPALQAYMEQAFPEEFAFKIDDAIFEGNGAQMPLGFINSPAMITIAIESAQATATLVTANVLKMWARMPARARAGAKWYVSQDIEPQLWNMTIGSGTAVQLLYTPPGVNGNNSGYGLLLGRPVIPIEQAPTLGSKFDIVLANLSYYMLAERSGMRADSSIHVAFLTGEVAFRFMMRLDGQPFWKQALTPFNGGALQSPFVGLAARP